MIFDQLTAWLDVVVWENSVREYLQALACLACLLVAFSLGKRFIIRHLERLAKHTAMDLDDFLVTLIGQIGFPVFFVVALYLSSLSLALSPTLRSVVHYAMVIVVTLRAVVMLQDILKYGIRKAYRRGKNRDDSSVEAVVASLTGLLGWGIWLLAFLFILDNMGVNISTLVAGIGIGGIAVALAAQAVLGDAFSAFSIFMDKPFEIGDFITVDDHMGTVEHVGIKTTRIRSLSGEQLVFANSDLTKGRIRNYKRMSRRRCVFEVRVAHHTPLERLKGLPPVITGILRAKEVAIDHVNFVKLDDAALVFEAVYYLDSADHNLYLACQQDINFAIMEHVQREDIQLACPARAVHCV